MSKSDAAKDPFDTVRKLVDDWEKRIDGLANQVMDTNGFSLAMNSTQNLGLRLQRGIQDAMAAHLKNINMPSRDDVLRLGEAVQNLDKRLARVEILLEEAALANASGNARSRTGPARTRKPPSQQASQGGGIAS